MGDVVAEESPHPFQVSWLEELPLLMAVQEREACGSEVSKKKKAAGMSSWLNREGRTSRVQWASALALWRGQRCGAPHASKVCSFLFPLSLPLGVSPFLLAFCVLWRPHRKRFSLLPLPRRDGCRQGDAPHDLFPSFASSLC